MTEEYGIHRTTLWAHLDRAEVPRRPAKRKLTDTQVQWGADQYTTGLSLKAVAAKLEVDAETLRKEFVRAGVERR